MKQDNPLEKYQPKITQLSTDNIYDKQLKSLEEMYGQSKTNLATQNQNQLQQAAVSQQLLQKYLPNQLNALGIQNTGMAQSSLVNLQNAYGLQRGNIQQAHQAGLSDLESNYLTNRANIEQNQYQQQQADQLSAYSTAYDLIGGASDVNQRNSLLEQYKNRISDTQYQDLQNIAGLYNQEEEKINLFSQYGVTSETGIDTNAANVLSFGSYQDGGTGKGSQDKYVKKVLQKISKGEIENGTTIDFNYGNAKNDTGSVYVYYNGKLYPTNLSRKVAKVNWENIRLEPGFANKR